MAKFSKFEEIVAWQKARILKKQIYLLTKTAESSKDFPLRDQIRRSTISIPANIAEGQGRRSDKEFAKFLNIALGLLAETNSHLYLAVDLSYIDKEHFDDVYEKLDVVGRMTFSLIKHVRGG